MKTSLKTNQQTSMKTPFEIYVIDLAMDAFWASIAASYPAATGGDFSMHAEISFRQACGDALTEWLKYNLPTEQTANS